MLGVYLWVVLTLFSRKEPLSMQRLHVYSLILFSTVLLATNSFAQEKKINRSDLPAAVDHTVEAYSQGASIRGFSKEIENGHTYYEAELLVSGHSKDVLMTADGEIVEVEEQVAIDSLSLAVKQGLQSKAGKGKLTKVESLTKHDKLLAYEAQVLTDGRKSEVQIGPDGKPLDHEE
jgi:hypothetical protein